MSPGDGGCPPDKGGGSRQSQQDRPVAAAADEWFELRARAEQLVAEANAALAGRTPPLDLVDEAGTGELAFVLRHGAGSVRVAMGRRRRRGWVDVDAELARDSALDLIIDSGACYLEPTTVVDLAVEPPAIRRVGRGDPAQLGLASVGV